MKKQSSVDKMPAGGGLLRMRGRWVSHHYARPGWSECRGVGCRDDRSHWTDSRRRARGDYPIHFPLFGGFCWGRQGPVHGCNTTGIGDSLKIAVSGQLFLNVPQGYGVRICTRGSCAEADSLAVVISPEPGSVLLLTLGVGGLAVSTRLRARPERETISLRRSAAMETLGGEFLVMKARTA
jgi:hypothetical protein